MPGVAPKQIFGSDLLDPRLLVLNDIIRELQEGVNYLMGNNGEITLGADLNMGGHKITGIGDATEGTDALTQNFADGIYGAAVIKKAMDVTGFQILSTARRLNDVTQQEQNSTFLNAIVSTPPATNTSNVTVVDNLDGTSTASLTAGFVRMADETRFYYAAKSDIFTNPVATTYYYYYYDIPTAKVLIAGPYLANTSQNQMDANTDGRAFIGTIVLNAGGGGTGGGGGDTGPGGCTEVGSQLEFYPNARPQMAVEECEEWYCFQLASGEVVKCARNTLVSVFVPVQDLQLSDMVEKARGTISTVLKQWVEKRKSHKMVVKEPEHGTYLANGVRLHNNKVIT